MGPSMGLAQSLGLTLAFLAPLPREWPGPRRPDLPRVNWWILGLTAWFLIALTCMPLSLALAEHWALQRIGAHCKASGGRVALVTTDDRRAYRCEPGPAPRASR